MSIPTEYESKAQQDYGSTASTNVIQPLLESKLAKRMSLNSPDATLMCSISSLTSENNPEPDSTQTIDRTMIQTFQTKFEKAHDAISRKESEYQISNINEGECDADVAVGTISGIVNIEEAGLENVTRLPYPVIHESLDTTDELITNQSTTTLMSSSMDSAIVQNITKLPQNFTLNVETGLANIATIQNVAQDVATNQTLWLPTILATSSTSALDGKNISGDRSQTGVSQIIITSATENYIPHSINNQHVSVKRSSIVTDANANRTKTSKVQILSNITIPKSSNIASIAQYDTSNVKDSVEPTIYGTHSHLYKLSASVTSIPHKHGASNSILNNKVGKTQSLISNPSVLPIVNQVQSKASIAYASNFQKASHLNRSMNKVNNGANSSSNSLSNVAGQCHIFSRMVPGPKLSVHSGRKNVNSFSSGKNVVKSAVSQSSTVVSSQKSQQQSSKPIKIIQQTTNLQSPNKNEMKSWAITHTNTNVTKTFTAVDSTGGKTIASQKLSPMQHKGLHGVVSLQKLASTKNEQQRLVLHSSQVILPNASPQTTTHSKSQPNQQVQRYVQNYITTNNNQLGSVTQISANQHLTAQILQSLSQPKLVLQAGPVIAHQDMSPKCSTSYEAESGPLELVHDQKRQIHGDPSTLLTADDIIGMEERPNINDELLRYPYHDLALVMLDHTYAVCAQSMPSISTGSTVTGSTTLASSPVSTVASLASGMVLSSPTLACAQVPDNSMWSPPTSVASIPANPLNQNTMIYKPQAVPRPDDDDDGGSVISSVDGQDPPRDGSDTETAPEGEEEGKTRCVCEFTHDDGYMICCDRCSEWQHVDCMGIDRQNIPDTYMCDRCQPRPIDRRRARMIQLRKREELSALVPSDSDSSDGVPHTLGPRRRRLLTVTTYSNTSGPKLPQFNQVPSVPLQPTPPIVNKRGPKRPRRTDIARKGTKRKIPEKRVKRKKDFIMNRASKYNQVANINQNHCLNDSYESAMTNHYSPELRAKVVRYSTKLGSMPNIASAINAHYCTTVPHAGGKILIATKDLKESMPVIELRGKYMLANQHRPQPQLSSRSGGQKPGPFLFFYRLPKDNTQICIDTRTYGNEARFVRRSCKPSAELQHSIVKGVLHVYIITISAIQSNTEITIGHDTTTSKQPCACGNPKHCNINGMSNLALRKMQHAEFVREKRTRNRRSSSSSPASPSGQVVSPLTPKEQNTRLPFMKQEKKSPVNFDNVVTSPVKYTEYLGYIPVPEVKDEALVPKEDTTDTVDGDVDTASYDETKMKAELAEEEELPTPKIIENYIAKEEEKAILEEVKPPSLFASNENVLDEDIPKDEYVEKPILPTEDIKSEFIKVKEEEKNSQVAVPQVLTVKAASIVSTRTSRTSIVSNSFVHDSLDDKTDDSQDKQISTTPSAKDKKKMTREERKMEAIMKAFERMEKAEQRKQEVRERQGKRRESDPVQPSAGGCEKEIDIDEENALQSSAKKRRKRKGRARTTSQNAQSNRRRLNSADSDMMTSGDEAVSQTSPHPTSSHLSEPEPRDTPSLTQIPLPELPARVCDGITEDVGLSSACLLVEAAVGPLENAFKLPKTKKSIVSEWLGKSPERTSLTEFSQPLSFSIDAGLPYSAPKPTLLTPRSLESLVQVASTIIGDLSGGTICADSSPEKSYYGGTSEDRFAALTPTDSPQKLTAEEIFQSPDGQSPVRPSLLTPIKRSPRNLQKELAQPPLEKIKTPKKYKRGLRAVIEDRITATRRTLRSTPQLEAEKPQEEIPEAPLQVETASSSVTPTSIQSPFQLPQHSAKKRWLRQAISEESDSPTAESPPNEMVTPLKKRRLARESLSCEPSNLNMHFEDVSSIALPPDAPPMKAINVEANLVSPQTYNLKPVVSPCKYDLDDYHTDNVEGTGSNEHSMDCKFDSGSDYLDINLRNRHDAKKFKMDIRRIIGVPGTEETTDIVEDAKDISCLSSELKRLSSDSARYDAKAEDLVVEKAEDLVDEKTEDLVDEKAEDLVDEKAEDLVDEKAEENNLDTSIELDLTDNKSEVVEGQEDTVEELPLNSKAMIDNIADTKSETHSNANSTETSGNSSPQVDEMDDIQKKIHSFHTENIQILKIRNKKLPKEKRKKVNLNFDLCMLDDQTVGVKLRTDSGQNTPKSPEVNGEVAQEEHDDSPVNVLPINVEDIPVPDDRPDSPPIREKSEIQYVVVTEVPPSVPSVVDDKPRILQTMEAAIPSDVGLTFSSHFSTGGLFSGLFAPSCQTTNVDSSLTLHENVPNMNIIKSAIDRTTNMENSAFMDRTTLTPVDELRNVQEILSRVNKMDSNNSVLLSGVLKDTEISSKIEVTQPSPVKTFSPKSNDPRLNPPPAEKPKPMRRKLSITEYRKRHNMQSNADSSSAESKVKDCTDQSPRLGTDSNSNSSGSTFRGGGSVSPLRISDDAIADDIDSRLERQLEESLHEHSSTIPPDLCSEKKGLFDAQPTQVERQRENLSERLRREFGLSLPEDEEARSATALQDPVQSLDIPLPSEQSSYEQAQAFLRPALPHKLQRFDR